MQFQQVWNEDLARLTSARVPVSRLRPSKRSAKGRGAQATGRRSALAPREQSDGVIDSALSAVRGGRRVQREREEPGHPTRATSAHYAEPSPIIRVRSDRRRRNGCRRPSESLAVCAGKRRQSPTAQESVVTHEISLVNHASLLHEVGGLRILSDPWLSGTVFANGWELVHIDGTTVADLSPDVIWLSHEHPDHFSPTDLKAVPKPERARIQVITRLETDRKVAEYCRQQGFSVTEMVPHTWIELSSGVRVMTGCVGTDSWLAVSDGETTVLNLNDCQTTPDVMVEIARLVGPVDLLATQFSYASWVGNPGDADTPRKAAANVFAMLAEQIAAVRPRQLLPFAAFVRFGHATNAWWNEYAPRVDAAASHFAKGGADVVVLFPGDSHRPGQPGPRDAIARWDQAYADAEKRPPRRDVESVPVSDMNLAWAQMAQRLRQDNDWPSFVQDLRPHLEPAVVQLQDLGVRIVHDIFSDELSVLPDSDDWDVTTTSDVFVEVLRNRWGRGTLTISGRMRLRYATALRFFRQTQLYYSNNLNRSYPESISKETILAPKSIALLLVS